MVVLDFLNLVVVEALILSMVIRVMHLMVVCGQNLLQLTMDRHRAFSLIWDTLLAVMRDCLACVVSPPKEVQQFQKLRGLVKSSVRTNLNLLGVACPFS